MTTENHILKPLVDACEAVVPAALWQQHRALVAVSGGADSVALFRAVEEIARENSGLDGANIIVGHVDHGLRGDDSKADAEFVRRLANEFKVEFASTKLDVAELLNGREEASEDLLRNARYGCLKKIAQDHNARYLFTGHHLNDQAETILFRIFRGTGLAGLKGIPAIRRDDWLTIVRPLLNVSKEKIIETLTVLNQPFCTDATNATNDYSRNFIRNEVLAKTRDYFGPHVDQAIARLADHAQSALQLEAEAVEKILTTLSPLITDGTVTFKTPKLRNESAILIRAVLIRLWQQQAWLQDQMTFERWQSLAEKICNATSTRYVENLPGDLRFETDRETTKISSTSHQGK